MRKFSSTVQHTNLTIRRRLEITSGLMIAITMITTLVCCLGCISVTVAWTRQTQTLSVMRNDDVLMTCREITLQITDAISKAETSGATDGFIELEEQLSDDSTYVLISRENEEYYSFGFIDAVDKNLQNAADEIGESGYISSGNRQLYMRDVMVADQAYKIHIFISKVRNPYHDVLTEILIVMTAMVAVFFAAYLIAKKFLTHFVFAKIMQPLETLEDGVRQIHNGNLSYRIHYDTEDEFHSICDSFNAMSGQLQTSTDILKHQEQNRKVLLASISHDLRSPLTTISAYTDGLLDGIAQNPEAQERYQYQIKAKVSEMIRMVNRLFMFSKMDMDEYPTYPVPLNLSQEIVAFVDAVKEEYAEKGLTISLKQTPFCPVLADPKQLHTVFSNIIENSLRYKEKENGTLEITVWEDENHCNMVFRDDGPGVPQEDIPKLFEVFFRSDPARKNSGAGSGLGLAIAANAIKRANGSITASNVIPQGLEITIVLPKGENHAEDTDH